jgi:hypothetical protein
MSTTGNLSKLRKIQMARLFIVSAALVFMVAGVSKFINSAGHSRILLEHDPVVGLTFKYLTRAVGGVEVAVALVCVFGGRILLQAGLLAWLATTFLAYRLGLVWIGYQKSCSCLGSLPSALHIPPQIADNVMKFILAYLIIGSYGILFHRWWNHRNIKAGGSALGNQSSLSGAGS